MSPLRVLLIVFNQVGRGTYWWRAARQAAEGGFSWVRLTARLEEFYARGEVY